MHFVASKIFSKSFLISDVFNHSQKLKKLKNNLNLYKNDLNLYIVKLFNIIALMAFFPMLFIHEVAQAGGFVCASGVLYKPDGSEIYVGAGACETAKLFGRIACVAGTVWFADGRSTYVGADGCKTAKVSPNFFCANAFLLHSSGWSQYVGTSCSTAVLSSDYACANGMLFKADGTSIYVGSQGCRSFGPK
jgi:hypothetical protein